MFDSDERTKPYYKIIEGALRSRGSKDDDYKQNPAHKKPNYVVRMCEDLLSEIDNPKVDLDMVFSKEQYASGHTDYHVKFALYCWELANTGLKAKEGTRPGRGPGR
jgi:hypothetical protein